MMGRAVGVVCLMGVALVACQANQPPSQKPKVARDPMALELNKGNSNAGLTGAGGTSRVDKVVKSDEEWRKSLTPDQYRILREKGTERAFTGQYHDTKTTGVYLCAACGQELFNSEQKYDSGCGWPSFWAPIADETIETQTDRSLGMVRTEVTCSRCGGHLGHVFDDGPLPTGLRYCINSASLKLVEGEKKKP